MAGELWELYPDKYKKCSKCHGSTRIDCDECLEKVTHSDQAAG